MISSLMILNMRGDVLIYRDYKGEVKRTECNAFSIHLLSNKNTTNTPVQYHNGVSYYYINQKDLYLLVSSKSNPNVALIFEFLYKFLNITHAYFAKELCDEVIRKNYVLIYELLDEILDYGVPQITETDMLKQYIMEGGMDLDLLTDINKLSQLTMAATGANSWRPKPVHYKRNNIYIDVIETVNVSFSQSGNVLKSDVHAKIDVNCELSGMPECTFGLNDTLSLARDMVDTRKKTQKAVLFKDMKFHRCVKLNKFNKQRAITFIPPDGKFILMNYIISKNITVPFKLISFFTKNKDKLEYKIKLKATYDKKFAAQNLEIVIPVPKGIIKKSTNAGVGKAKLDASKDVIVWRLKKFQGKKEALLRIDLTMPKDWNLQEWNKPPITLNFSIPMFTSSGVVVTFLKVIESSAYKTYKWIRYLTKSGEFTHRL